MTDVEKLSDLRGMLGTEVAAAFKAVAAERDEALADYRRVLNEHNQFMNDMLAATDVEIDEDGPYILDQIVTAARKAREERDALRGAGADARAEAAVMGHAEAYRLVEEARQMREERDAAQVSLAELRTAFRQAQLGPIPGGTACWLCQSSWRHDEPEQHSVGCVLAQPAPERGAALLEAADRMAEDAGALLTHFRRHTDHRCEIDRDADKTLNDYRALRPASDGQRGGGE